MTKIFRRHGPFSHFWFFSGFEFQHWFLPRCRMQTRSSDENTVRLSVSLSNTWIVTKRKKDLSRFLYHTKEHLA